MDIRKTAEKFIYTPAVKENSAMPVWFCFPADFPIGMSSLGFPHLFRILDENPYVLPERIFTDTDFPFHNPKNVKLAGFSFSFELDFLGLFKILDKFNIPLRANDRDEKYPLFFAGGPVVTANPEPFAAFFDFFLIGDGEELFNQVIEVLRENEHLTKHEKLTALSRLKGVYVPCFYEFVYKNDFTVSHINKLNNNALDFIERKVTNPLNTCIYTPIISSNIAFSGMFLVEIARGCPMRCRFCIASYLSLPARYPSFEEIIKTIEIGLEHSDKLGLLGALISLHPDFEKICSYLIERRKQKEFKVSVSSLRADKLTPLVAEMLYLCGQKNITIAVEAGSERLRKVINKRLTEETIASCIQIASENGLTGAKIYGMVGLPTETDEDIYELIELFKSLKSIKKGFKLTLSISSFVPKAQTPFEREERVSNKIIKRRIELLKKGLAKINVDFKPTSTRWDYVQSYLSRADRRVSDILEKVYRLGGNISDWNTVCNNLSDSEKKIIPNFDWYALRERSNDEILPWDILQSKIDKEMLKNERSKALIGQMPEIK